MTIQAFTPPLSLRRPRPSHSSTSRRSHPRCSQHPLNAVSPEHIILRPPHHDTQVLAASQTALPNSELSCNLAMLRRQRLSLLLADLTSRIRCEKPISAQAPPLSPLLRSVDTLASLVIDKVDAALRAEIRRILWDLRMALQPLAPSESLRKSMEVARSSFLDIPGRVEEHDEALVRSEMYALMVENVLLEELRSLRLLERQMNVAVSRWYPGRAEAALTVASDASALLGIDDYRVRGKTRLAEAVLDVRRELGENMRREVDEKIQILYESLVKSLQTDLAVRRPAGKAMLLRPRMDDIPNFAVVNGSILRGGQPSSRGLEWLGHYGVRLVVDLRGSDRDNQWEMPIVEGGMKVCNVPVEDFCTPSLEQVWEFLRLIEGGERVFVHCKAGIGRTGTMIACWRIWGGEDVDVALGKERLYTEGGGGLRQEQFVREFAKIVRKDGAVRGNGKHGAKGNGRHVAEGNGKAVHGNGKAVHGNGKAVHGNGKAVHGNGKAVHGNGKAVQSNGKPIHGNGKAIHSNSEANADGIGMGL